tara:strand:+ start:331 stop:651 length:321 start_codon:yes stop_codon:yes gene_type:complete
MKAEELQELAIWMTGCGYDFTQHKYYMDNKHLLTEHSNQKEEGKAPKKYGDLKYFDNAKPRFKPTVDRCVNCDGEGIIEMGSVDAPMVVKCSECDGRGWNEKHTVF